MVHLKILKILSPTTPWRTDRYASVMVEIRGGTEAYRVLTVHPKTLKILSPTTLGCTDRFTSVTVEIRGSTSRYTSVPIKTLVLPGRGWSAYRYPLGPVCTARTAGSTHRN